MALNLFNLALTFHLKTGQIQRLCCLAFLASSRPCLSHAKTRYKSHTQWSRRFMYERLLWDIPEIFGAKDGGRLISQKITRV